MFYLDVLQKFELLSGHCAGYQIQVPVKKTEPDGTTYTVNELMNGDLTVKDVLSMALSKTTRVVGSTDYLIQYSVLYNRFLSLLRDIEDYEVFLNQEEKLKSKSKNKIEKPLFEIKNKFEVDILIDLVDKALIYPKDDSLDNIVRGSVLLLLSKLGVNDSVDGRF